MGYGEGFDNPSTLGILFAALAALMSSIFQVLKVILTTFQIFKGKSRATI